MNSALPQKNSDSGDNVGSLVCHLKLWGTQRSSDPEHKNYSSSEWLKSNKLKLWSGLVQVET